MGVIKKPHAKAASWVPVAAVATAAIVGLSGAALATAYQDSPTTGTGTGQQAAIAGLSPASHTPPRHAYPLQAPIVASGHRDFDGEGEWHALTTTSDGRPEVQGALVQAQGVNDTAAVAWIHQPSVRFELHPGYEQPGGTWSQPDWIPDGQRRDLLATWNGGFLMYQSEGGFYLDGKQSGPLVDGAASEVFFKDGSMTVGRWGRDVAMGPDVAGVRQQLHLMVDHGEIAGDIDSLFTWGITDSGATYVRRSGVGVTASGDIVYVVGPLMSPRSLATALQKAGAVRAMELDINISWPSFMAYDGAADPASPRPAKWGNYPRSADRYYHESARDFVAVYERGADHGQCAAIGGRTAASPGGSRTDATAC